MWAARSVGVWAECSLMDAYVVGSFPSKIDELSRLRYFSLAPCFSFSFGSTLIRCWAFPLFRSLTLLKCYLLSFTHVILLLFLLNLKQNCTNLLFGPSLHLSRIPLLLMETCGQLKFKREKVGMQEPGFEPMHGRSFYLCSVQYLDSIS